MNQTLACGVLFLTLITLIVFLASCVIALTDGQGALVFIVSIPAMAALLFCASWLSQKIKMTQDSMWRFDYVPKVCAAFLTLFFISSFVPVLREVPDAFMKVVGKTFTYATGKTPYVFFKDRASFPNRLSNELEEEKEIILSNLDVTFAWDRICIFGPYTNNEKAKSVLHLNWNIEERSHIHFSDSINALVFLFQGNVNHVVDLKRNIVDFKDIDICLDRNQANFEIATDASGLRTLRRIIN